MLLIFSASAICNYCLRSATIKLSLCIVRQLLTRVDCTKTWFKRSSFHTRSLMRYTCIISREIFMKTAFPDCTDHFSIWAPRRTTCFASVRYRRVIRSLGRNLRMRLHVRESAESERPSPSVSSYIFPAASFGHLQAPRLRPLKAHKWTCSCCFARFPNVLQSSFTITQKYFFCFSLLNKQSRPTLRH